MYNTGAEGGHTISDPHTTKSLKLDEKMVKLESILRNQLGMQTPDSVEVGERDLVVVLVETVKKKVRATLAAKLAEKSSTDGVRDIGADIEDFSAIADARNTSNVGALMSSEEIASFFEDGLLTKELADSQIFKDALSQAFDSLLEDDKSRALLQQMAPDIDPTNLVNCLEFAILERFNAGPSTEAGEDMAKTMQRLAETGWLNAAFTKLNDLEQQSVAVRIGLMGAISGAPVAIDALRGTHVDVLTLGAIYALGVFAPFAKAWKSFDKIKESFHAFVLSKVVGIAITTILFGLMEGTYVQEGQDKSELSATLLTTILVMGSALMSFITSRVASREEVFNYFGAAGNGPSAVSNLVSSLRDDRLHEMAEKLVNIIFSKKSKSEKRDMLKVYFLSLEQHLEQHEGVKNPGLALATAYKAALEWVDKDKPAEFASDEALAQLLSAVEAKKH